MNTQTKWTPTAGEIRQAGKFVVSRCISQHRVQVGQWIANNPEEIALAPEMAEALREIADAGESGPLSIADIHSIKSTARAILTRLEGGVS